MPIDKDMACSRSLWWALVGRCAVVGLSAVTLAGLMVADEVAQPETIEVPARQSFTGHPL